MTQVEQIARTLHVAEPEIELPLIIITNDLEYRRILERSFRQPAYKVLLPESLETAEYVMDRETPSVVIIDSILPAESWRRIMKHIESSENSPKVVVLRARNNKERSLKLIGQGGYAIFDEAPQPEEIQAVADEAHRAWLSESSSQRTWRARPLSPPFTIIQASARSVGSAAISAQGIGAPKKSEDIVRNFTILAVAWFITFVVTLSTLTAFWTITGVTW